MKTVAPLSFIALAAALVLNVGACKEAARGSCKKLYTMLEKCDSEFDVGQEKFLSRCDEQSKSAANKAALHGELGCSARTICDEFQKCLTAEQQKRQDARRAKQLTEDLKKLGKEIKGNKFRDASYTCEALTQDFPADTQVNKLCGELPGIAQSALRKELVTMRDVGEAEKFFTKCFDLKDFAKKVSNETYQAAETLCKEVDIARAAKKALDAVDRNVADKKAQIPFDCSYVLKQLSQLKSEWSIATATKVANQCFVVLGNRVMKAKVPSMKYVCEFNVKKVFDAATQYQLKDEKLSAWVEKARALCEKK